MILQSFNANLFLNTYAQDLYLLKMRYGDSKFKEKEKTNNNNCLNDDFPPVILYFPSHQQLANAPL